MNSIYVLSATLVVAGLYIVYLHNLLYSYRKWMHVASHALKLAYDSLVEQRIEEE